MRRALKAPREPQQRSIGRLRASVLPWLLASLLLVSACDTSSVPERALLALDGRTMGTSWSLRVAAPPPTLREAELQAAIDARLAGINGLMSTYDPDSELSRFNAAGGSAWFSVDAELVLVIDAALELSRLSDGAFDVTVGPLVELWGFGPGAAVGAQQLPDAAAISAARARTGWQRLQTRADPPALRKEGDIEVDLSAIAKGYGVDAMAQLLEARGVTDYLVEIGGELRARGRNARNQPWRVGVEVPDPGRRGVAREAVGLDAAAVATSGDYRNFFTVDGIRYSHTLDPATGRPIEHAAASVTVLHPSAMWADGWATTLNVLGAERGLALAAERQLPVLFILYADDGLQERSSPEFEAYRSRSAP